MYFSWIWKVRFFSVKIHFPSKNWAKTIDFWQISTILWSKLKIRPPSKQKRAKCAGADNPGNNILRILHYTANFWEKVSSLTLDSKPGKPYQQKNRIGSGSLGTRLLNTAKFISINSRSKFLSLKSWNECLTWMSTIILLEIISFSNTCGEQKFLSKQ